MTDKKPNKQPKVEFKTIYNGPPQLNPEWVKKTLKPRKEA